MMAKIWLVFIAMQLSFSYTQAQVCNYSGLLDTKLARRVSSVNEYLRKMSAQLPGRSPSQGGLPDFHTDVVTGRKITFNYDQGGIESVTVDCDEKGLLRGSIYYSNLMSGYVFLEVTDSRYKKIELIPLVKLAITSGSTIPFEVKISAGCADGTFLSSQYLKITYVETENTQRGKETWFDLPKRWKKEAEPGSIKVTVLLSSPVLDPGLVISSTNPLPGPRPSKTGQQARPSEKPPVKYPNQARGTAAYPGPRKAYPVGDYKAPTSGSAEVNNHPDSQGIKNKWTILDLSKYLPNPHLLNQFQINVHGLVFDSISNAFLYFPRRYQLHLKRNAHEEITDIKISYGTLQDQSSLVNYNIVLSTGISVDEEKQLAHMIRTIVGDSLIQLKPLVPDEIIAIDLSLGAQLGIAREKINISTGRSLTEPLLLQFACDPSISDDLLTQFENNISINGNLKFKYRGAIRDIPIQIKLDDAHTFGKIIFPIQSIQTQNSPVFNPLPFPITLNKLWVLNTENFKSVNFTATGGIVNAGSGIRLENKELIPADTINTWKNTESWFEYTLVTCKPCLNELVTEISSGSVESRRKFIRFQSFYEEFFDQYAVKSMKLSIKSIQADPRKKEIKTLSSEIKPGGEITEIGPLYAIKDNEISFQYQYTIFTEDNTYASDWMPAKGLELFLQKDAFQRAFRNTGLIK